MFIYVFIPVIIVVLLFILSMVWPPDSPWAPWWRTNKKTAKAICKIAGITSKDIIYDLGCGDGEVLIQAAKLGAKGTGIEIDPIRVIVARLRVFKNKVKEKVTIKRNNFFDENISKATVVIVYLVPKALERLLPKFRKELRKGTRIVSFRYEVNMPVKKIDKKNNLRLYII